MTGAGDARTECVKVMQGEVNLCPPHVLFIYRTPLQFRVPRGAVRTLKRFVPPVPEQRAQLEPFLPATDRVHRPLVAQVNVTPNRQALRVLV